MHAIPFFSIIILALDTKIKKEAKKKVTMHVKGGVERDRCINAWRSNKVILVLKNESDNFFGKKRWLEWQIFSKRREP
jgi:hypothetical protein